jgi:hypothetical protein
MYRPLPDGLTVKGSEIDGLGLFATKDFPANTVLGMAHVKNVNFPHGYIRTAVGAFYNHSEDPSCIVLDGYWQHMPVKYLVTKRAIKAGDELTASYTLYDVEDM